MSSCDSFGDKIANLAYDKFKSLSKQGKPTTNQWTCMSCIVKEENANFEVVSLGTGSKCIGRTQMSSKGDILNDSHSEIICRRAFLRYLYHKLESDLFDPVNNKFVLKKYVKFHFFTTQVPCGDAAIFPKVSDNDFGHVIEPSDDLDYEPDVKKLKLPNDLNRTGAKCLENEQNKDLKEGGLKYHVTKVVRTKPGRGDPTPSLSCSDKFAKWIILGIQGALLSIFLKEPIFLSTFTISSDTPFNIDAFQRALYDRFAGIDSVKTHKLEVFQSKIRFEFNKVQNKLPCSSSVIYSLVELKSLEVSVDGKKQGVTKKMVNTKSARVQICKIELFNMFMNVLKRIDTATYNEIAPLTYAEVKTKATEYQRNWRNLKILGFKNWTIKDPTLLNFTVD